MRVSELSAATGVPVATIKYYLREGLVPPGESTAPNQARYEDRHVSRVRLIRALRDVAGLSIEQIGHVLETVDDPARNLHDVLGASQAAFAPDTGPAEAEALHEIDDLLTGLGWTIRPTAPDRTTLANALTTLRQLGHDVNAEVFLPYAEAVEPIAAREVAGLADLPSREDAVEYAVVGSVVFDAVLSAVRRLAHEHHSAPSS